MSRPRKQEQEPASNEVTEVGPGVLRMQLPITMPGLGHVNAYALLDDRGAAVVDPGLPGPGSWKSLVDRLATAGLKLANVHTVLVTHSHPDHYGGAGRLAEETGAELVTHAAFRDWWSPHSHADAADDGTAFDAAAFAVGSDVHPDDMPEPGSWGHPRFGGPTPWGKTHKPPFTRRMIFRARGRKWSPPSPSRRMRDGEVVRLAGRDWSAVHTPGHTLDHLCLHDPEGGLLLSGDHVLPTITPHISGMNTGRDPLALFFDSLDKVAASEGVEKVLPAHGHPFDDLRARTEAIKRHHRERLARLQTVASDIGVATVEEFSHHLFRPERWGSMAESETYAHLEHLRLSGRAERRDEGGVARYEVAPESS